MNAIVRAIMLPDAERYNHALDIVARDERFLRTIAAPPLEGPRNFVAVNIGGGSQYFVAL